LPTKNADLAPLVTGVRALARRHKTTFETLVKKRSALLEYAALLLAVERYAAAGYTVATRNLVQGKLFRIKTTSSGYPWNFSWYEVRRDDVSFELLTNAKVAGDFADSGTYVVDVAVIQAGSITEAKGQGKWFAGFSNGQLKTFVESKALAVYPMLLAQFVGIALEIKPAFVRGPRRPYGHIRDGHFDPTLVALGSFSANADKIVERYPTRGYLLNIVVRFDTEAASGTFGTIVREMTPRLIDDP
jgi:hypothetical protein